MTQTTLPISNIDDRLNALRKGCEARAHRANIKKKLKKGEITLSQVIADSKEDTVLARLRIREALQSLPGVGPVKAKNVMEELKINSHRRLRGLGIKQEKKLIEKYS